MLCEQWFQRDIASYVKHSGVPLQYSDTEGDDTATVGQWILNQWILSL